MIDLTLGERPLTIEQVTELLSVSRRTLDNWFSSGLERMRMGGRVYTSLESLQRFSEQLGDEGRPLTAGELRRIERDIDARFKPKTRRLIKRLREEVIEAERELAEDGI